MKITRIIPLLVLVVSVLSCGPQQKLAGPNAPDVLFFVIDTLRADHLGCYGYPRDTSPTMDQLAKNGVRAADVTAQAPWTGPSMVSMLLSRYTVGEFIHLPPQTCMAKIFADAGYRTLGAQFNPMLCTGSGFERGFHEYLDLPRLDTLYKKIKADDKRPLFLYVHVVHPHLPYEPMKSCNIFKPGELSQEQRKAFFDYLKETAPQMADPIIHQLVEKAAAHVSKKIALYDGSILQSDMYLSHVLNALPRREKTLVVTASDHGEGLYEHLKLSIYREKDQDKYEIINSFMNGHNTLLTQEMVAVPLIFQGPGVPKGVALKGPVENVDILPTILDLVGLDTPNGVDGKSLVPIMEQAASGQNPQGKDLVFSNTKFHTSVRLKNGQKLIHPWKSDQRDGAALYNLIQDPMERNILPIKGRQYETLKKAIKGYRNTSLRPVGNQDIPDALAKKRLKQLGYL